MPAKTEKQKKFFGAVMGAKKGKKGIKGAAKKTAKQMPKKEIKKFLKKKGDEDEETFNTSSNISKFITSISSKNYADANKYLKAAIETKLSARINKAANQPLF
jgi:SLT domain-containing protein